MIWSALRVIALVALSGAGEFAARAGDPPRVTDADLERVYEAVRTPYKYGVVLKGAPEEMIDCPAVYRHEGRWWMTYIAFDGKGYEIRLARSEDLLAWEPLGVILARGSEGWDNEQCAGSVALQDHEWEGGWGLEAVEGRYWLSYLGGTKPGYETPPLSLGLATTDDPTALRPWTRIPENPVMQPGDASARAFERDTLFRSHVIHDRSAALGHPYVMFYNARQQGPAWERIGIAVSDDLRKWTRYGDGPVIDDAGETGAGGISGDPQVVKIGDLWVMFYFGAGWRPGAFDTFAVSRDLAHWRKWKGPDLTAPSESWDREYAHKPWVIRHDGVVYHFYCAVGDQGRVIAVATSRDLRPSERPAKP